KTVMEAGPDAGVCDFIRKVRHVRPTVGHSRGRWARHGDFRDFCTSEHSLHDACDAAALDAMCARIFRMHRSSSDGLPRGAGISVGVSVDIAIANCRDRSPEVVLVL